MPVREHAESAPLLQAAPYAPSVPEAVPVPGRRRLWTERRSWSAGLMCLGLGCLIVLLKAHNVRFFWYEPFLQAYSLLAAGFVLTRVLFASFYRVPRDMNFLPTVTLVIAAKNEKDNIAETVECCFRSAYPPELMEVIAVDDGSDDGTWEVLESLRAAYPRLRPHRFEENKGKRHAMAFGAEQARGQVLVYVDSDSFPEPDALYKIVQPFADARVGAVSGHVLAVVEDHNFISKMESVRYYVSHRLMKAAESVFGAVTCCPGAFSAYRRDAVMAVLPAWLGQRFLGTAATFGDDRSLTNFILRRHSVVYHAGALCHTYVPDTWRKFIRQQLRWKKSWMRETTVAARVILRKNPLAALSYYAGVVLTLLSTLVAVRALVVLPIVFGLAPWSYLGGLFLMYLLLCMLFAYFTDHSYWYYGLAFAGLYLCFFTFQNYYAMLTVNRNHWGTR
jgi:hyaluronan synthase